MLSDFLFARPSNTPSVMAAYPVSAITGDSDAVILASVSLDWMSKIMSSFVGQPGVSAVLIDSEGTVLAAPEDEASLIGRSLDAIPLLSAIADKANGSEQEKDRCRSSQPTAPSASSVRPASPGRSRA